MNSSLATLAVFLIAAMFLSQAHAQYAPSTCCYDYQPRPIPQRNVKSFEYTNARCNKPAVIFTTKKDKRICADPNASWVQDRIRYLSQN